MVFFPFRYYPSNVLLKSVWPRTGQLASFFSLCWRQTRNTPIFPYFPWSLILILALTAVLPRGGIPPGKRDSKEKVAVLAKAMVFLSTDPISLRCSQQCYDVALVTLLPLTGEHCFSLDSFFLPKQKMHHQLLWHIQGKLLLFLLYETDQYTTDL